jgi:hypothetical protein
MIDIKYLCQFDVSRYFCRLTPAQNPQFIAARHIPGFILFAGVFRREIRERYPLRWAMRSFRLR